MPSMSPGGSRHVRQQHAEAAEYQYGSRRQWNVWHEGGRDGGKHDDCHDLQGERAVIDEQSEQLANHGSQHAHGKTSARGRRARVTAQSPTARNSAANATIARSAPGQSTPRPSPVQNTPNADSITPTANLSVFSGTCASGR